MVDPAGVNSPLPRSMAVPTERCPLPSTAPDRPPRDQSEADSPAAYRWPGGVLAAVVSVAGGVLAAVVLVAGVLATAGRWPGVPCAAGSVAGGVLAAAGSVAGGVLAAAVSVTGGVLAGAVSVTGGVLAGAVSVAGGVLALAPYRRPAGCWPASSPTSRRRLDVAEGRSRRNIRPSRSALVANRTRRASDLANRDFLVVRP